MRYVIVGAGGIGGAIGGRLADAGHDVVLVARSANAGALRERGLRLAIPERVIIVRPPVVESVADLRLRRDDVLVLCVKSQDSAGLLAALAVLRVGNSTAGDVLPLVCAQNGTSNEREALRLFRHVHGISLMLSATHLEPGRVSAPGWPVSGVLELGRYPSGSDEVDASIAADFNASGFVVNVRNDVMAWKRAKLLRNLRNALEAMCGPDLNEDDRATIESIRAEASAEARACFTAGGLTLVSSDEWNERRSGQLMQLRPVEGSGRAGGSTWQSVTRGLSAVETDYLNGEIVLLGRLYGVATPVNERIQLAMWDFVRDRRPAGSMSCTSFARVLSPSSAR
ncbi:MAG: 2-dehydropantoate 2-reductase [Actinomycetota bacterium]|nr:2-dehydropantoate 2-reductase [Actinomycetota bacterium]